MRILGKAPDGDGSGKGDVEEVGEASIIDILERYRVVAVVGLSKSPDKDSYLVAEYLKAHGYRIIPLNPTADQILGERCYPGLLSVPEELQREIEVVDIFRRAEDIPPIVEDAVKLRAKWAKPHVVWMQLGIVNEAAARRAREAGFEVVMDRCMRAEHRRIHGIED